MVAAKQYSDKTLELAFAEPVFLISAPRCGSTLLFNLLKASPDIWTIGGESHGIFQKFPHLVAENKNFDSGGLNRAHADALTSHRFKQLLARQLRDRDGSQLDLHGLKNKLYFLEKTPRNALNVPFIKAVFPSAKIIFLHRDPRANISSIIEAWGEGSKTGRFVTFRDLPGWDRKDWCLLLPRGWREFNAATIPEIAAFQWRKTNEAMLDELEVLPKEKWVSVSYERLLKDPLKQVSRLCSFAGVRCDSRMKKLLKTELPLSETIVTPPKANKWKRHENEIEPLLPGLEETWLRLKNLKR